MRFIFSSVIVLLVFLYSCNLDQEIDIELPDYENHFVVECYLSPGENYRLLLSRSSAYFDPFSSEQSFFEDLLVSGARVYIHEKNRIVRLFNQMEFDLVSRKVFNYTSDREVPLDYEQDFRLEIITSEGDTLFATTRILPAVPIDSVVTEFSETTSLARVLTYFTDIPDTPNYYRRMLHENKMDTLPSQDFTVDDRFVEDVFVFGTGYDYVVGDTVFNTIFHIDEAYYNFLETFTLAVGANGNPFGQPSPVATNLSGTAKVIGIFTGLTFDRERVIIKPK